MAWKSTNRFGHQHYNNAGWIWMLFSQFVVTKILEQVLLDIFLERPREIIS